MTIQAKDTAVTPLHYQGDYVMRVIEDFRLDFCDGTVVKYLLRAGKKPGESSLRDHKKASWYLNRKIRQLQSANAGQLQPANQRREERQPKKNRGKAK